jgi:hypothetical protein
MVRVVSIVVAVRVVVRVGAAVLIVEGRFAIDDFNVLAFGRSALLPAAAALVGLLGPGTEMYRYMGFGALAGLWWWEETRRR